MTDHLDQAAAKAWDLAAELCTAIPIEEDTEQAVVGRRLRVAAHLTYMAGLLRGGGVASYEDEALVRKNVRLGLQLVATQRERDEARAQHDKLLAAAREVLRTDGPTTTALDVLERIVNRIAGESFGSLP